MLTGYTGDDTKWIIGLTGDSAFFSHFSNGSFGVCGLYIPPRPVAAVRITGVSDPRGGGGE